MNKKDHLYHLYALILSETWDTINSWYCPKNFNWFAAFSSRKLCNRPLFNPGAYCLVGHLCLLSQVVMTSKIIQFCINAYAFRFPVISTSIQSKQCYICHYELQTLSQLFFFLICMSNKILLLRTHLLRKWPLLTPQNVSPYIASCTIGVAIWDIVSMSLNEFKLPYISTEK